MLARYGGLGASSRIRHHDLVPGLREHGFAVEAHCLLDDAYLQRFYAGHSARPAPLFASYLKRFVHAVTARRHDLIWIEKEAFPWLPWLAERVFHRRNGPALVVDFDDFWPSRYLESRWSIMRRIGPRKFTRALMQADAVTVANARLAGLMAPFVPHGRLTVIENGIDTARYAAASRAADMERSGTPGPLRVGWIGTPFTAAAYLPPIAQGLNRLTSEGIISVTLIGAGQGAPEIQAERLSWSEESEAAMVAALDVGLMPLGGSTFDAGKSGWKLVQFMAAFRPVVASPVGFNEEIVTAGVNGLHAGRFEDFESALRLLAADPETRHRMGAAAGASIQARFSRERAVAETIQVFEAALRRRDGR